MKATLIVFAFCMLHLCILAQSLGPSGLSGLASQRHAGNASLSSTSGPVAPTKLQAGNIILTQGIQQPEIQINTDTVTGHGFHAGDTLLVPFSALGYVDPGNVFTAQLSDSTGSFAAPVTIGSLAGTASGTLQAVLPQSVSQLQNYKIRVTGSAPAFIGRTSPGYSFTPYLSVPAINACRFNVYPNPFVNELNVSMETADAAAAIFTVTTSVGQVIYKQTENKPAFGYLKKIDLSSFPKGVYLLEVDINGNKNTIKAIKQ